MEFPTQLRAGQKEFAQLMSDTLAALRREDQELKARFDRSDWPDRLSAQYSQGIGSL